MGEGGGADRLARHGRRRDVPRLDRPDPGAPRRRRRPIVSVDTFNDPNLEVPVRDEPVTVSFPPEAVHVLEAPPAATRPRTSSPRGDRHRRPAAVRPPSAARRPRPRRLRQGRHPHRVPRDVGRLGDRPRGSPRGRRRPATPRASSSGRSASTRRRAGPIPTAASRRRRWRSCARFAIDVVVRGRSRPPAAEAAIERGLARARPGGAGPAGDRPRGACSGRSATRARASPSRRATIAPRPSGPSRRSVSPTWSTRPSAPTTASPSSRTRRWCSTCARSSAPTRPGRRSSATRWRTCGWAAPPASRSCIGVLSGTATDGRARRRSPTSSSRPWARCSAEGPARPTGTHRRARVC